MKTQTKILMWTIGLAGAGYAAYKIYKYYKEEESLKEKTLTIEDIRAYKEGQNIQKDIDERNERLNAGIESSEEEDLWYENSDGVLERRLTREEKLYGADYDFMTEEVVEEYTNDGTMYVVVRKLADPILLNHRDPRALNDILESVADMYGQIQSLKANDMEYEEAIYDADTQEAYDYYIALTIDRLGKGVDAATRHKLMILSAFEYKPSVNNEKDTIVLENIRSQRYEHLGVSPFTTWASVAEVIMYYAHLLNYHVDDVSVAERAIIMVDMLEMDTDDIEVVVNDIIVSFFEHNRDNLPNFNGTYGLFGITEDQYQQSKSLRDECDFLIKNDLAIFGEKSVVEE